MCSTAAHQPSEVVRLCRSTYASRYRAVELNTLSRRNRTPHALLARGAEGLKRSSAAYLVRVKPEFEHEFDFGLTCIGS